MSAPDNSSTWEQPPSTQTIPLTHAVLAAVVTVVLTALLSVSLTLAAMGPATAPSPTSIPSAQTCYDDEVTDFGGNCVDAYTYHSAEAEAEGIYQMGKDSYDLWRKKTKHLGKIPPLTFFCAATTRWEGAFYIANAYGLGQAGFTIGLSSTSGTQTHVSLDRKDPLTAVFRCSQMPGWARVEPLNIGDPDVP